MNWLSRIRRTLAAGRKPAPARDSAGDPDARSEPRTGTGPNSTFGYGALVIGNSQAHSQRSH